MKEFSLNRWWQKRFNRYSERLSQINQFKISYPPRVGLNLGNSVAADVPSQPLTLGSQGRLRKLPLGAKASDLCTNDVYPFLKNVLV
jgi:hypothetical protein